MLVHLRMCEQPDGVWERMCGIEELKKQIDQCPSAALSYREAGKEKEIDLPEVIRTIFSLSNLW